MTSKRVFGTTLIYLILSLTGYVAAKPILEKNRYLIATYDGYGAGVVSPNEGATHQLIYDNSKDVESAEESDYWIIKNISDNHYTFQNSVSGKYIRYDNTVFNNREALKLVDNLFEDNSTSFVLEHHVRDGISYYQIISVTAPQLSWNKRNSMHEGVYPVGVYGLTEGGNSLFVFYDNEGDAVVDDGKVDPIVTVTRSLGNFEPYLKSFKINGKTPAPDLGKHQYYTTLSADALPASSLTLTFDFELKDPTHSLAINGEAVQNGVPVTLSRVNSKSTFRLEVLRGIQTLESADLFFTSLPIVQINSENYIGDLNVIAQISVAEAETEGDSELLLTKIKIRGASSRGYPKKSYAVNMRDESGTEKENYSFFGLRSDNKWILDAMYVDPSRMRNRVSTDLWNDFATLPYWADQEANMVNGTRGQYVEVFLNDRYHGLYCMTERVDRKQLKLKTIIEEADYINNTVNYTQRGALYKAKGWTTAVMFGYPYRGNPNIPYYSNYFDSWETFEVKYPNDDGEPFIWDNLYDAIRTASKMTDDATFLSTMHDVFDLPVYLDYFLFIELMLASDNHGKNTYASIYNQQESPKVTITPWDLDGTWGRRWDGKKDLTYAAQDFESFLRRHEHGTFYLFDRMKQLDADEWESKKLKERYLQLRGNHFSFESLMGRFQTYANDFTKSGAIDREMSRWGLNSLVPEINYLSEWIQDRLDYLDIQYLGELYTSTSALETGFICGPSPVTDRLLVTGLQPKTDLAVYNLQGVLMHREFVPNGSVEINMSHMPAGVYLVKTAYGTSKIIKQ